MAEEMQKLKRPILPSRLAAVGTAAGNRITWQLGSELPKEVSLTRNGQKLETKLTPNQTTFIDRTALPGKHQYELVLNMPKSGKQTFIASCDTSVSKLDAYRSLDGVMLNWEAGGRYEGFKILRDGKVITDSLAGDARSFLDKQAPTKGKVPYCHRTDHR